MHQVGSPYHINPDIPPRKTQPSPSMMAGPTERFSSAVTRVDVTTRELGIYYLLSLSSPYQVQLMHTRLLIPDEPSPPKDTLFALGKVALISAFRKQI